MSRAMNRLQDLGELNNKLEQTIMGLHQFSGRLVALWDNRDVAKNVKESPNVSESARPRADFFTELDLELSRLASNLGYLDGLINNLESEVFGERPTPTAGLATERSYTGPGAH